MNIKHLLIGAMIALPSTTLPVHAAGGGALSNAILTGFARGVPLVLDLPFRGSTIGSITPRSVGLSVIPVVNAVSLQTDSEIVATAAGSLPGIPFEILHR